MTDQAAAKRDEHGKPEEEETPCPDPRGPFNHPEQMDDDWEEETPFRDIEAADKRDEHSRPFDHSINVKEQDASRAKNRWRRRAKTYVVKTTAKMSADPALIRAMDVKDLMRGFAAILGSNLGSTNDYMLSNQVSIIGTFLSHNWSTPRLHKLFVLAYCYNIIPASVVMLIVSAALFTLMVLEVLPNVTVVGVISEPETSFTKGLFCLPLGTLAFFVTLFGFHEVTSACCQSRRRHTMFLDKTCINQVDPELKMKGIQSLAAFLSHSGEMLVIFNDMYMQKLWTVYEVATWLMLHKGANMVVRPTFVPRVLLATSAFTFLWELSWDTQAIMGYAEPETMTASVRLISSTVLGFLAFTLLARIVAWWTEDRESISGYLATFKFSDAKCFCEDDRSVVQENIVSFMKFSKICPEDASPAEAVSAFEDLARQAVPKAMDSSFGWVGFSYSYVLAANFPRLLAHFDRLVGAVVDCVPAYDVFWHVVDYVFDYFVLVPLFVALVSRCMSCKLMRSWCGCIFIGVSGFAGMTGSLVIFNWLTLMVVDSPVWLAIMLPLRALTAAAVFLFYRPVKAGPVQ